MSTKTEMVYAALVAALGVNHKGWNKTELDEARAKVGFNSFSFAACLRHLHQSGLYRPNDGHSTGFVKI